MKLIKETSALISVLASFALSSSAHAQQPQQQQPQQQQFQHQQCQTGQQQQLNEREVQVMESTQAMEKYRAKDVQESYLLSAGESIEVEQPGIGVDCKPNRLRVVCDSSPQQPQIGSGRFSGGPVGSFVSYDDQGHESRWIQAGHSVFVDEKIFTCVLPQYQQQPQP